MSHFVLGVTGASGSIYATRTAMYLQRFHHEVTLIVTHPGKQVLEYEGQSALFDYCKDVCNVDDFFAECASGSSDIAGMAVVPCSMGTLGRIAAGTSDNLLVRAADVCLKERRPLVIVPREMPYNLIHIENMKRVTLAGAVVRNNRLLQVLLKCGMAMKGRFPLPGTSPGQAQAGMTNPRRRERQPMTNNY